MFYISRRRFAALIFAVLTAPGCESFDFANLGRSVGPYPQSQEIDFSGPLKMKIEQCKWSDSFDRLQDLGGGYENGNRPQALLTPQSSFLVITLALSNYGNDPLSTNTPPVFRLQSSDGRNYDPVEGLMTMTNKVVMSGNINPGQAMRGHEVFDVPAGKYQLMVYTGERVGAGVARGGLAWIWDLEPTGK